MKKSCGNCIYCITEEYGYSCYTILGWSWRCRKNKNPHFPMEDAGEEQVHYAEECERFIEGERVHIELE